MTSVFIPQREFWCYLCPGPTPKAAHPASISSLRPFIWPSPARSPQSIMVTGLLLLLAGALAAPQERVVFLSEGGKGTGVGSCGRK